MNVAIFAVTFVAVVANILFVWPQTIRLLRTKNLSGVSPGTWTISVVLFSVWAAFAYTTSFWALLVANVSCLCAAVLLLTVGTATGWSKRWAALSVSGVGAAVLFGVFAPIVLAVVMSVAGVALRVPQMVMLIRSPEVSGVSASTWWLSFATAGAWLIVSLNASAYAVVVANASALATTGVLLGLLYWRKFSATEQASMVDEKQNAL